MSSNFVEGEDAETTETGNEGDEWWTNRKPISKPARAGAVLFPCLGDVDSRRGVVQPQPSSTTGFILTWTLTTSVFFSANPL
jgi:hypothetical protein